MIYEDYSESEYKLSEYEFDNYISIDQIIDNYVDFINDYFTNYLNTHSISITAEYLTYCYPLPSINQFLTNDVEAIKISEEKFLYIGNQYRNTTVYERIFSKITEILSKDIDRRYHNTAYSSGYLVNIDGATFHVMIPEIQYINNLDGFKFWINYLNKKKFYYYSLDSVHETVLYNGNIDEINRIPDYVNINVYKEFPEDKDFVSKRFKVTKKLPQIIIECDNNLLTECLYERLFQYISEQYDVKINASHISNDSYIINDNQMLDIIRKIQHNKLIYQGIELIVKGTPLPFDELSIRFNDIRNKNPFNI